MKKALKIAFITAPDPDDRRSWSGTTYFIRKSLATHVGEVINIGPIPLPGERLVNRLPYHRLKKHLFPMLRSRFFSRQYANVIHERLSKHSFDLAVAPVSSMELAYVRTDIPIVYISDATFPLVHESYDAFKRLSEKSSRTERFYESRTLEKSTLLIYPSQWAADSAKHDYGIDESRIRVIPFGPNIDHAPSREDALQKPSNGPLNLLFLAKEWKRKGGDVVIEAFLSLVKRKVNVKLTILGIKPEKTSTHPAMKAVPYLDKNNPDDRKRFTDILKSSHLLLLPSQAECYGIVLCEANAYGIPVLASKVGGIPTIVNEGENGFLLPVDASGEKYADVIIEHFTDPAHRKEFNQNARNRYENVLNWDQWGKEVAMEIERLLKSDRGSQRL